MTTDSRSDREQVTRDRLREGGQPTAAPATGESGELPKPLRVVVDAIEDRKGQRLLVLDLRGLASFADFMVLCDGSSERHVQAIADAILENVKKSGRKPLHTEGYEQASWILVDFIEFLVNVFTPETRDYYQLERLWRDAPAIVGDRHEASEGAAHTS